MARDYELEFQSLKASAQVAEKAIAGMFRQYAPEIQKAQQELKRKRDQADYNSQLDAWFSAVDKEQAQLTEDIRTVRWPLLNSKHYSDQVKELQRLRGSMDQLRAAQYNSGFPTEVLRREFDAGNVDFAFSLIEYVGNRQPKDETEFNSKAAFVVEVQRIEAAVKLPEMRDRIKRLESLKKGAKILQAAIRNNFDVGMKEASAYLQYVATADGVA